jgi:cysteine desulfurase/selenocysteine lyase
MDLTNEFPLDDEIIYLNHAAVSPWPRRTVKAVERFAQSNMTQGSLDYPHWLRIEQELRGQLQQLINAPSSEDIALVKNTSEGLSFVAYGVDWKAGDNIVSSDQEFPSNRIVWESLTDRGIELRQAVLDSAESPEEALFSLVDEKTRMITISSVQYGSGLRMDLKRIGQFCAERDILFCVDAIQSLGAAAIDVQGCHIDFLAADGHKWMLGPEGLGVFYCRSELRNRLKLTQFGWHMVEKAGDFDATEWQPASSARRFECGSPNMLTIHALHASLSLLLERGMKKVEEAILANSRYLIDALGSIPEIEVITPASPDRHLGIITFRHGSVSTEQLHDVLSEQGVFCAQRGGGVRFSPHFYTPREKLETAIECVANFRD